MAASKPNQQKGVKSNHWCCHAACIL